MFYSIPFWKTSKNEEHIRWENLVMSGAADGPDSNFKVREKLAQNEPRSGPESIEGSRVTPFHLPPSESQARIAPLYLALRTKRNNE